LKIRRNKRKKKRSKRKEGNKKKYIGEFGHAVGRKKKRYEKS